MIFEPVEFTYDYIDQFFSPMNDLQDARFTMFKKYCKSLNSLRNKRKPGTVIISLQVMDDLKYTNTSLRMFLNKVENNEIRITDSEGVPNCDIIIAAFGSDDSEKTGWRGTVEQFTKIVSEHDESGGINSKSFLGAFPEVIMNNTTTKFYIFGVVNKIDDSPFDIANVTIIGMPNDRATEIHNKNIRGMFNY